MARAQQQSLTAQTQLDTRALEMVASVDGRQNRHEDACEKRYIAMDAKLDAITTLLLRIALAVITLLLGGFSATLWYVITHKV